VYDPAAEAQAFDSAHRIGQDKPVFVYKLIVAGSVEEKILDLQIRKKALADTLFDPSGSGTARLTEQDLERLRLKMAGVRLGAILNTALMPS
jgi:SNF2 family DNA or RNA helicase